MKESFKESNWIEVLKPQPPALPLFGWEIFKRAQLNAGDQLMRRVVEATSQSIDPKDWYSYLRSIAGLSPVKASDSENYDKKPSRKLDCGWVINSNGQTTRISFQEALNGNSHGTVNDLRHWPG